MRQLARLIAWFNSYQQRHRPLAFSYAVIKKYGEDTAGSHAALLTYYGFLSLFPLLLVLTTITDSLVGSHPHLEATLIKGITGYFPLLGSQLSSHVHGLHSSGLALVVGIVFTLYGARGVADAFRQGIQHVWQIPKAQHDGFPTSLFKNLGIIIIGGAGFIAASVCAGLTSSAGHGLAFRGLSLSVNLFLLFWLFTFLLNFSLPRPVPKREIQIGAAVAAIGLVLLQSIGGYILARELKSLDALYSYFALALGLLFWIYLQAQLFYYAVEIAIVRSRKLWPRSVDAATPTVVDLKLRKLAP